MIQLRVDETVEIDGFVVEVEYDASSVGQTPWGDNDADIVRKAEHQYGRYQGETDKRPYERPLNTPSRNKYQFYYNWKLAMKKAKQEKWNTPPYDAPNQAERAVQANFDFYKAFLADEWYYVDVSVRLQNYPQYGTTVGGFETHEDYHKEGARDLAREVIHEYLNDIQAGKLKKE